MKILFFGDVNGKSGRAAVQKILPQLKSEHKPDLVIANAENVAHGKGITLHTLQSLLDAGVDFFTTGNHVFDKPEAREVFEKFPEKIIRPANFPDELPGKGYAVMKITNTPVLIINLNGQVFMEKQFDLGEIGNPFLQLNEILGKIGAEAKVRLLDFHGDATSEKRAMGFFADGRLSAVIGTHSHVPTADAQILANGTGYITDAGMVGAADSVIGVETESVLQRFLHDGAGPLEIAESDKYEIGYCLLEIDEVTGKCKNITNRVVYLK